MVGRRRLVSFARPPWRDFCGSMDNEYVIREGRSDRTRSRDNDGTSTTRAEAAAAAIRVSVS